MPVISAGLLLYRRGRDAGDPSASLDVRSLFDALPDGEAPTDVEAPSASAAPQAVEAPPAAFEVLLVHPGGPYWAKKDAGAWSIPKGEADPQELGGEPAAPAEPWQRPPKAKPRLAAAAADLLAVAKREFREETGFDPDVVAAPGAAYLPLGGVKQRGHKLVYVWALEGDCDPAAIVSNTFTIEWPPRSGRSAEFPEVDRAAWFGLEAAREKILAAQRRFVDDLAATLGVGRLP